MNISLVTKKESSQALTLLGKLALPIEDINDKVKLFALEENEQVLGTIGLEHNESIGLLRSLSVDEAERGKGYGDALVKFLETNAREKGITTMYLLTTTAANFFSKKGYIIINRNEVPAFIQQTTEFSSVCPSSAIVMKKIL